jgi:hypothetical protein
MKLFLFGIIKCKLYEIVTDAIWCIFIASYWFAPSHKTGGKSAPFPLIPLLLFFNSLTYVCIKRFFLLEFLRGLFFSTRHYLCTCVTFSCHWNIIRLDTLFFLEKNTISMANDGTENWQKTVLLSFLSLRRRLLCFHRVSVVYDKWWCRGMCIMLNNILFENFLGELSVVNRSLIRIGFCEEVVKLNGVMHSWKEAAVK